MTAGADAAGLAEGRVPDVGVRVAAARRPQFVFAPFPLPVPLDPLALLPGVPGPLALVPCDPADAPGVP